MPDTPENTQEPNGIVALIQTMRGGELEAELDAELQKIVALLRTRGGAGKITLTINIKDVKEFNSVFAVSEDVKVTLPKAKKDAEFRFPDADGGLVLDQPEQGSIFDTPEKSEDARPGLQKSDSTVTSINKS